VASRTTDEHRERGLERREWRLLAILGLPTFAYALATTVATTYLPVLASEFVGSTTVVGLLIAVEGIMALLLAVPAGVLSDRRGGRLPFVLAGSPVLVIALAAMGFATSLPVALVAVVVFFAAYFVAYEPYRALYPDLVDDEIAGRAQSTQALWRGLGTIVAISAGGVLLAVGDAVPFVAGAAVTALAIAVFVVLLPRDGGGRRPGTGERRVGDELRRLRDVLARRGDLRAYLVANGLWELALGAMKTFIILYLTRGLGISTTTGALAVAGGALFIAVASPVSGKLADRFGAIAVMRIALIVYGLGLLVPFLVTAKPVIALAAPVIAFGGGVVMTLPYALLIPLMDDDEHGLSTGLYSLSRGIGTALGPLLAGVAIQVLAGAFGTTQGYQAMWGVCAVAVLASVPVLGRLRRERRQ
jgi:predicted MFS family arabinose efflux permease